MPQADVVAHEMEAVSRNQMQEIQLWSDIRYATYYGATKF